MAEPGQGYYPYQAQIDAYGNCGFRFADVLLIGLGKDIAGLDRSIREALRAQKIIVEAIATGGAVRTYNILLGEKRAVGAAFIAVDSAR
jgi:uncharacterized protein